MRRICLASALALAWACGPKAPPVLPAPDLTPRLDRADQLIREGCFDCLGEALHEYDAVRATPRAPADAVERASAGIATAAVLLNVRQRELGMADEGYLATARDALASDAAAAQRFAPILSFAETVPWNIADVGDDTRMEMNRRLRTSYTAWKEVFVASAGQSAFDAYIWLAFACATGDVTALTPDDLTKPFAALPAAGAPLLLYKMTMCPARRGVAPGTSAVAAGTLAEFIQAHPRFIELEHAIGLQFIFDGRLEEANAHLQKAYDWHPRWTGVVLSLASVALTAEDFSRALSFYDTALSLAPGHRGAMLGRTRALTSLGRHEDAIAQCDEILTGQWNRGDAFYYRAWNELQLERLEAAWSDVEDSWKLMRTGDVAKLAGMVAHRRQQIEVAREKFETAHRLKPDDCENGFLLGLVDAELTLWKPTTEIFMVTAACLENEMRAKTDEIARINASSATPERKARQIAKREKQIQTDARMQATSWYDIAVGYYNLSRPAEARAYAEKVSDDKEFGERAKEILARAR